MILSYKYRLYANNKTLKRAEIWLDLCRFLYNSALEQRISAYKHSRKSISYYEQQNELPEIKKLLPEYKEIGAQTLQDVLRKLERAYANFFRRVKNKDKKVGFPRFKGKYRFNSFTLTQNNWELEGNRLHITKLGTFKIRLSRPIQDKIKVITIRRSPTNKWYVIFSCNNVTMKELPKTNKIVGIDVGISSYLTDSEGNKIENPKFLKNSLIGLRVKNRKLARAKKGSSRRKNTRLQVAKCHEKITNQRNDFLHKLSSKYVTTYDVIKVENLNINGMIQNRRLSRNINDCAWGIFFDYLSYKAGEAGKTLIKVPCHNTSKRCHNCGSINHDLKLSDRIWICESCGYTHDRDENAAKNILKVRAEPSVANVSGSTMRRLKSIETCTNVPV